jgi:hypothetical protein
MSELSARRTFRVVALEPAATEVRIDDAKWINLRVEEYHPDIKFDWINVRHSAYYMDDPVAEMGRLTTLLHCGGSIALTHWSRDCVLHRLHVAICGDQGDAGTSGIEDIAHDVTPSFPPAGIRAGRLCCASARLKQWAA